MNIDEIYKIEDGAEFKNALKEAELSAAEEDAIIIERYKYLYQKYRPSEEHFKYMRSRKRLKHE